jgi:homogentisate phytyltransferase/homogentisate geranylgeranyltransferase
MCILKDLSDVRGDAQYNISTFASQYGVQRTAAAATSVLAAAYLIAAALPSVLPGRFRRLPMMVGHIAYLAYLLKSYCDLDGDDERSVGAFYGAIWNLFYLEYFLYPFI